MGPEISGPAVIGVAVDAATGQIWFSLDGDWMGGGDPGSGQREAVKATGYGYLFPAAGVACVPPGGGGVTVDANFGAAPFLYEVPEGFRALVPTDCACSKYDQLQVPLQPVQCPPRPIPENCSPPSRLSHTSILCRFCFSPQNLSHVTIKPRIPPICPFLAICPGSIQFFCC